MTFANTAASLRPEVNAPENVAVVPTGAALGAEIRGVDLSQPVPEATKEIMRRAWADHLVLLWRGQNLPDLSFLEAAGIFGVTREPAARKYQVAGGYKIGGKRVPLHPHVSLICNLNEEGEPVMDNGELGSDEVVWHSDNSYTRGAAGRQHALFGGDSDERRRRYVLQQPVSRVRRAARGSQTRDRRPLTAPRFEPQQRRRPAADGEAAGDAGRSAGPRASARARASRSRANARSISAAAATGLRTTSWACRTTKARALLDRAMGARDPAEVCVGHTSGASAISCCGTTAARCTTAPRWTSSRRACFIGPW